MGWYYCNLPLKDQHAEVTVGALEVRKTNYGRHVWAVMESAARPGYKFIAFFLFQKGGGQWGYKPMEESMYPYYFDCPLELLDMVTEECPEWRAKVRAWHEAQRAARALAASLQVGTTFVLPERYKCREFTVVETGRKILARGGDGRIYRVSPKQLADATVTNPTNPA